MVWHVITGQYEVMPTGLLRRRANFEMRSCAIPWATSIPKSWGTVQCKDELRLQCGYAFPASDFKVNEGVPIIRQGDVENTITELHYAGELHANAPWVETGDLIITLSGDYKIVSWSGTRGLLNQRIAKVISSSNPVVLQAQLEFVLAYLKDIVIKTTIDNLAACDVESASVPQIPKEEANRIAIFLLKVRKSTELAQKRLTAALALAEQQFQSLVWHVVTGKYEVLEDGTVRKRAALEFIKPTCDWIGSIPKSWCQGRLKDFFKLSSGGTPPSGSAELYSGQTNWVQVVDIDCAPIAETRKTVTEAGLEYCGQIYPSGSLVFAMYASIGKVAKLAKDAAVNQAVLAIQGDDVKLTEFTEFFLRCNRVAIAAIGRGTTQVNLNEALCANIPICFPTGPVEFDRILKFLRLEQEHYTSRATVLSHLL